MLLMSINEFTVRSSEVRDLPLYSIGTIAPVGLFVIASWIVEERFLNKLLWSVRSMRWSVRSKTGLSVAERSAKESSTG